MLVLPCLVLPSRDKLNEIKQLKNVTMVSGIDEFTTLVRVAIHNINETIHLRNILDDRPVCFSTGLGILAKVVPDTLEHGL